MSDFNPDSDDLRALELVQLFDGMSPGGSETFLRLSVRDATGVHVGDALVTRGDVAALSAAIQSVIAYAQSEDEDEVGADLTPEMADQLIQGVEDFLSLGDVDVDGGEGSDTS